MTKFDAYGMGSRRRTRKQAPVVRSRDVVTAVASAGLASAGGYYLSHRRLQAQIREMQAELDEKEAAIQLYKKLYKIP